MAEPVKNLKAVLESPGMYVLLDVYSQVDSSYFAESPLNTGILRKYREEEKSSSDGVAVSDEAVPLITTPLIGR